MNDFLIELGPAARVLTMTALICLATFVSVYGGHIVCILVRQRLEKKRCD